MTKKAKRIAAWVVWNVPMIVFAIFGLGLGKEWARNILKFWIYISCLPPVAFALLRWDEMKKEAKRRGPALPPWIILLIDMGVAATLAARAMWFYAALVGLAGVFTYAAYDDDDEDETKPEAPPADPPRPRPISETFTQDGATNGIDRDRYTEYAWPGEFPDMPGEKREPPDNR